MISIKYFILGVIFYIIFIPIIEAVSALCVQGIEVLKGYLVIILHNQQQAIKSDSEENYTRTIGFSLPEIEEEEEDDDYDE